MNADNLSVTSRKAGVDVDYDAFKVFSIDNSWDETYGWSIGNKDHRSPTTETGNNESHNLSNLSTNSFKYLIIKSS